MVCFGIQVMGSACCFIFTMCPAFSSLGLWRQVHLVVTIQLFKTIVSKMHNVETFCWCHIEMYTSVKIDEIFVLCNMNDDFNLIIMVIFL